MTVTIQLPADISAALGERWDDVSRRSLEAIAIEGYRTGALNEEQVRRVPGSKRASTCTRCSRSITCRGTTHARISTTISPRIASSAFCPADDRRRR